MATLMCALHNMPISGLHATGRGRLNAISMRLSAVREILTPGARNPERQDVRPIVGGKSNADVRQRRY